jgi:hypothetical protein
MDMVCHQYVGVDRAIVRANGLSQTCQIEAIVFLGKEGHLAVVAALNDMLGHIRNA